MIQNYAFYLSESVTLNLDCEFEEQFSSPSNFMGNHF